MKSHTKSDNSTRLSGRWNYRFLSLCQIEIAKNSRLLLYFDFVAPHSLQGYPTMTVSSDGGTATSSTTHTSSCVVASICSTGTDLVPLINRPVERLTVHDCLCSDLHLITAKSAPILYIVFAPAVIYVQIYFYENFIGYF